MRLSKPNGKNKKQNQLLLKEKKMATLEIPKSEYAERIEKVRGLMRQKKLDAVFVYHNELHMCNGCYLTNYWPTIEAGAVLVPLEGEPVLLGGPEAAPYAMEVSAIQTLKAIECFIVPEEEYPGSVIHSVKDFFAEAMNGKALKQLGMVGYGITPYDVIIQLQEALPKVELVDITREYTMMRAIKSPAEIKLLERAFDIGAEGMKAAIPMIKPGVTEYEVLGPAEGKMISLGADGFNFRGLVGSGERSNGVVPPATGKKLCDGELVLLGFSPKVRGYAAGAGLTLAVNNPPSREQMQHIINMADALEYTRDALKPGAVGKDIYQVPKQFLTEKGYGDYLSMSFVHTVGLNEYELPYFGPTSDDVLEENLTVCIDIAMFGHPTLHGSRHEAGYVITSDGARPLSEELENIILSVRDPNGIWSQR
jgi:Xaa-Pro aminopeptidase